MDFDFYHNDESLCRRRRRGKDSPNDESFLLHIFPVRSGTAHLLAKPMIFLYVCLTVGICLQEANKDFLVVARVKFSLAICISGQWGHLCNILYNNIRMLLKTTTNRVHCPVDDRAVIWVLISNALTPSLVISRINLFRLESATKIEGVGDIKTKAYGSPNPSALNQRKNTTGMPLDEVKRFSNNPRQGTRTVESVLEEALFKAGAISNNNYGDLKKIGWSRASRTDKGVHAAKSVVVAKLLVQPHDFDNEGFNVVARDEFNALLPSDLHVFSVSRVPKSFRGRPECSYREYEYYFPRSIFEMGHANNNYELRLKNLLARYLGTNSFHNFSSIDERRIEKRKVKDKMRMDKRGNIIHRDNIQENPGPPHCDTDQVEILEGREENKSNSELSSKNDDDAMMCGKRQKKEWEKGEVLEKALRSEIITTVFACQLDEKPILVGNTKLLRIFIRGKSFLYHQIRLMVGAAIAEALELVPDGTVEAALKTSYQINFALAPGEGLVLSGQGFTGGSAYGNAAVLDPMELSQLQGTLVDYDEGSGNNMASKGRVQSLCQPGDILASENFKSNTILPEITRAWEAENNNLVEDWIIWAQRKSTFEEFHLALVAAKEKMAVADHSNDLIKCNAYREMAFAKEESVQMKEYFPRGFNTSIMVTFNLIPGPKVQSIQLALLNRMKSGTLPQLAITEELLDCVAREGVESMAREGGFVGCLEGKA